MGEGSYTFIRPGRQLLDGNEIPAAALTAYARGEDRLRALSAEFQMRIPKLFEPAELLTVVASLPKRLQ
jgi:CheY-like chemotaxis protein